MKNKLAASSSSFTRCWKGVTVFAEERGVCQNPHNYDSVRSTSGNKSHLVLMITYTFIKSWPIWSFRNDFKTLFFKEMRCRLINVLFHIHSRGPKIPLKNWNLSQKIKVLQKILLNFYNEPNIHKFPSHFLRDISVIYILQFFIPQFSSV